MGILDELKSQSGIQEAVDKEELLNKTDFEKYYQENIQPKMLQLYSFFTEFTEQLNLMAPILASYPVKPDGGMLEFEQSMYKVIADNVQKPKNINFSFFCSLKAPSVFKIENIEGIERYSDLLTNFRIKFERKGKKTKDHELVGTSFRVIGLMPVNVILQVNLETFSIDLVLNNFEMPGKHKYVYKDNQITEKFIDDLGRYIIRQNPDFLKLDINDENKEKIRQNIQAEMKRRQQELEEAEQLLKSEEEQEAEKKSWKNIFKKNN